MLATCSACAGDYEDPDRTSWMSDDGEQAEVEEEEEEENGDDSGQH